MDHKECSNRKPCRSNCLSIYVLLLDQLYVVTLLRYGVSVSVCSYVRKGDSQLAVLRARLSVSYRSIYIHVLQKYVMLWRKFSIHYLDMLSYISNNFQKNLSNSLQNMYVTQSVQRTCTTM